MLDALRRAARGFTAKILLGLLIASFAVWGVSSAFVHRQGDAVVTAGETVITPNEYRLAYARTVDQFSRLTGGRLTQEQAAALGVEQTVLQELVSGAVLDEQARLLDLGISVDELARLIAEDPAFQGFDGTYDRSRVRQVLRSVGMTEEDYLQSRRRIARRQQLLSAIGSGAVVPAAYADAITAFDGQTRDISFVRLAADADSVVEAPTDERLQSYFEENRERYRAPEYRSIRVVRISADALADPDAISDEALRDAYERDRGQFTVPASRDVETLLFPSREEADAAVERLRDGTATYDDLIVELGASADAIRQRGTTPETFPDATLADAAFALGEGETSDVIDGRFGPVVLRASNLADASERTFEEVADELRLELARDDARQRLFDTSDAFEDARAGGATFEEAAGSLGLPVEEVGLVDRGGLNPDGQAADVPDDADILGAAFGEEAAGEEAAPLDAEGGGFVFYQVDEIVEARDRDLDEVRADVLSDYGDAERSTSLSRRAAELETGLRASGDLAALATELGVEVERGLALTRSEGGDGVPAEAVSAAFSGGEGHVALVPQNDGYLLLKVDTIAEAADASPVEPGETEGDILQQFVAELQETYRPTFDAELARVARGN